MVVGRRLYFLLFWRFIVQIVLSTSDLKNGGVLLRHYITAMQRQTAVTAHLKIKQLLSFAFALITGGATDCQEPIANNIALEIHHTII